MSPDPLLRAELRQRIDLAREAASEAFFAALVERFPEITTGDFSPEATDDWETASMAAVERWVTGNLPEPHELMLRAGDEVVFVETVERYPHACIPAGARGVVVRCADDALHVRPYDAALRAGLEGPEWEGCVIWYGDRQVSYDDAQHTSQARTQLAVLATPIPPGWDDDDD